MKTNTILKLPHLSFDYLNCNLYLNNGQDIGISQIKSIVCTLLFDTR